MISYQDRKDLIDSIMKMLKVQTDRRRDTITRKSVVINPQLLATRNPAVYGPYYLETSFAKNPFITFGQVRLNQTRIKGVLVVTPYVDRWISSSGGINGLYLGVYAHTPVPPGLVKHTINWQAVGKASLYKGDFKYDNWQSAYNSRQATHLYSNDGDLEKPG